MLEADPHDRRCRRCASACRVNLCGEMAGRPLEAMALIGLGLTSISMAPAAIGPVKTMILALDRRNLWAFMEPLLQPPRSSLRDGACRLSRKAAGIPVDLISKCAVSLLLTILRHVRDGLA